MAIQNPKGPHHVEHETGGVDALVTLDGSIILTGTIPDARHSANMVRLNTTNAFTAAMSISAAPPTFDLLDTSAASGSRALRIQNSGGNAFIYSMNETNGLPAGGVNNLALDRLGNVKVGADVYEKARTTPMGHWIDMAYNAANFTASAGTWTVDAGDVFICRYSLIGRTMLVLIQLNTTTISASPGALKMALPAGVTVTAGGGPFWYLDADGGGWKVGLGTTTDGVSVSFVKNQTQTPSWVPTTNAAYINATLIFQQ